MPHLVVGIGSAGSRTLDQTGIYQAKSLAWRDMDASVLGFEKGVTPFLDLPARIDLPLQVPGIPSARLSTGSDIVSGAAYDRIDADMVDMESFALWRAANRFGIGFVTLRGISDGRDDLTHIGDWAACLPIIDEKLAVAVDKLEAAVAQNLVGL